MCNILFPLEKEAYEQYGHIFISHKASYIRFDFKATHVKFQKFEEVLLENILK